MMRVGPFKPVHVKTMVAQQQRMLLTSPKLSQAGGVESEYRCEVIGERDQFHVAVQKIRLHSVSAAGSAILAA